LPLCLLRRRLGANDDITVEKDSDCFALLPHKDKHFIIVLGRAHVGPLGTNRHRFFRVIHAFLNIPPRRGAGTEAVGGP
jgi:hypothetical protein